MHLEMSSGKWRPFFLGLNDLMCVVVGRKRTVLPMPFKFKIFPQFSGNANLHYCVSSCYFGKTLLVIQEPKISITMIYTLRIIVSLWRESTVHRRIPITNNQWTSIRSLFISLDFGRKRVGCWWFETAWHICDVIAIIWSIQVSIIDPGLKIT